MGGGGWMRDQAFGVAEVVGDADQPQRIEETEGAFLAAFDFERAKRRTREHLLSNDIRLRVIGPAGRHMHGYSFYHTVLAEVGDA